MSRAVHIVTRNEEIIQENEFLIDLLIEVAEGTHKCERLYNWYCEYSSTGKWDNDNE